MMRLNLRLTILISLILALAACGNDKKATIESGGRTGQNETVVQDAPSSNSADLTATTGKVILVKGYNLYSWQPATANDEVLEVENIDPNQVYFTPDQQYILYSITSEEDRRQILDVEMMQVSSGVKTRLTRLESRYARPAPNWWLQDSNMEQGWFLLGLWVGRQESVLVKTDGSQRIDLGTTNNLQPIWLADGTLLGVEFNWNQQAQLNELARVWRLDPAIGTPELFTDLDVATYQNNWSGLIAELEARGIQFVEPPQQAFNGINTGNVDISPIDGNWSDICNEWTVRDNVSGSTIYQGSDIAQITNLTPLEDGSYIVAERAFTNCDFDFPTANLRRVVPGQDALLLSDTLDPGSEGAGFAQGWNMSVSPDGHYLLWVGGGVLTGETTLNLTDLTTNTTTILRQEKFDILPDGSAAESARYKSVFWVAL